MTSSRSSLILGLLTIGCLILIAPLGFCSSDETPGGSNDSAACSDSLSDSLTVEQRQSRLQRIAHLPPSEWVERYASLIRPGGKVLDLAAGAGRHTRLLLNLGLQVEAVDRDTSFLEPLVGPRCTVRKMDLESGEPWALGKNYDGIVVTNYLHRPLLADLAAALAPGGLLIYETFMVGNEAYGPPRNPEFLLRPNELMEAFPGMIVIAFEQGQVSPGRNAVIQRIVAAAPSEVAADSADVVRIESASSKGETEGEGENKR